MLNGDYYNWEDQELKVLGVYENNERISFWENRSYLINETNSFSVLMFRDDYVDDDGDTLMQERVILHKNLKPLIEIYYKGNRPYSSLGY